MRQSTCRVVFGLCWDTCAVPMWTSLERDYINIRTNLLADMRQLKLHGMLRRQPEKGLLRIVLAIGWAMVHLFALITFAIYGAFVVDPGHTVWWFLTTVLAGIMYISLMYSNPGFLDHEELLKLTKGIQLGIPVTRNDITQEMLAALQKGRSTAAPAKGEAKRLQSEVAERREGLLAAADAQEKNSSWEERDHTTQESDAKWNHLPVSSDGVPEEPEAPREPADSHDAMRSEAGPSEVHIELSALPAPAAETPVSSHPKHPTRARVAPTLTLSVAEDSSVAESVSDADLEQGGGSSAGGEAAGSTDEATKWAAKASQYFSGYCEDADMLLPIRAKYCKKHRRVVAKFDHYCYAVGNSIGELNHGQFYRMVAMQVASIWNGHALLDKAYLSFGRGLVWAAANIPLLILNVLTWIFGVMLSILLLIHTFHALTSSTTYEFIKLEKLEYMNGFYQFSFPFSEGLIANLRHFCCPVRLQLWKRPPPESEWPETFWRNRYYHCCC